MMILFPPPSQHRPRPSSTPATPMSPEDPPRTSRSTDYLTAPRRVRMPAHRASGSVFGRGTLAMAANRDERALRRPARPIRSISTPLSTFTAKQHDQRASVVTLQPSSPPYLVTAVVSPVVSAFARIVRQRPGFDALPLELRVRVFKYLSVVDVMRAARVCRAWKMLAYDGTLWSNIDVTPFYRNISGEQLQALGIAAGGFLKVANFRGCIQLTSQALRTLAECCPNVHTLQLSGCRSLSSASIACFLGQATHLEVLDLSGLASVTNGTLQTVAASCPSLRRLNIAWCKNVSALGLQSIARGCPRLTHVRINGCSHLDETTMTALGNQLQNLSHLCLASCTTLTDVVLLAFLATAPECRLTHLSLSQCHRLTDDALRNLAAHAPQLTHLELAGCTTLTNAGITALCARVQGLTTLDLEDCTQLTDAAIRTIAASQSDLRRLALSNCAELTDDAVATLLTRGGCARALEHLELDNCPNVTDAALAQLAAHLVAVQEEETGGAGIDMASSPASAASFFSSSPPTSEAAFPSAAGPSRRTRRHLSVEVYDCAKITEQGIRDAIRRAPQGKLDIKSFYTWRDARRNNPANEEDESENGDDGAVNVVGAVVAAAQRLHLNALGGQRRQGGRAGRQEVGCVIL